MTPNPPTPQLSPTIRGKLRALRRWIRAYVWLEGTTAAVAWLGAAFWASLAIDWFFEPEKPVRALVLGITAVVLAWLVVRLILRRTMTRLSDRNMAMLLERHSAEFNESLLTAVELTGRPPAGDEYDPRMLSCACRKAEEPIRRIRLWRIFNPRPLALTLLAAIVLTAAVGLFALRFPQSMELWARRSLAFSGELWPRNTRLVIDGFQRGVVKVARGSDLDVIVKADLRKPRVPTTVEIRYRTREGGRQEVTMSREGLADPGRDRYQQYTHTFRGILTPITFDVAGGDAELRDLRIEVVDSPRLVETQIECRFPAYMHREPRRFAATGAMPIPLGSEVTLHARSNKRLLRAQIDVNGRKQDLEDEQLRALADIIERQRDLARRTAEGKDPYMLASDQRLTAHGAEFLAGRIRQRITSAGSGPASRPPGLARLEAAGRRMREAESILAGGHRDETAEGLAHAVRLLPADPEKPAGAEAPETRWHRGIARVREGLRQLDRIETEQALVARLQQEALAELEKARAELEPCISFRNFEYTLLPFREDKTVLVTLYDTDGIKSREPVRLSLAAQPDQPPQLALQLHGISSAITPQALIPAAGRVTDDYGIDRAWFDYAVDQGQTRRRDITSMAGDVTEAKLDDAFDVRDLGLKPGQKFLLDVKASDHFDLAAKPNIGTSDQWQLDVVTPKQLQTMLEAREVMLRQRFQTTIDEVTQTRDSLVHMEFAGPAADGKKDDASKKAAEPGEKAAAPADSPERRLALRVLRVQRAMQNSQKDAQESLGVAQAFGDIRGELVNNRIYTEELRIRIEDDIVHPLERIAGEMFPELDRRLDRLGANLKDEQAAPRDRDLARQQIDFILQSMRQVLSRMVEMEDYNETVELLRSIIASQEKIRDATIQLQKQKLRSLLEE